MIDSICIMQLVSPCEWPSLDLCPRKSKGVIIQIFSDFDSSFSLKFSFTAGHYRHGVRFIESKHEIDEKVVKSSQIGDACRLKHYR
jgi:hypothetical protein